MGLKLGMPCAPCCVVAIGLALNVRGCSNLYYVGAVVTLTQAGQPTQAATTDSQGNAYFTLPASGTWGYAIAPTAATAARWLSPAGSGSVDITTTSGTIVYMTAIASGYDCGPCQDPLKSTLAYTYSYGCGDGTTGTASGSLAYDATINNWATTWNPTPCATATGTTCVFLRIALGLAGPNSGTPLSVETAADAGGTQPCSSYDNSSKTTAITCPGASGFSAQSSGGVASIDGNPWIISSTVTE